MSTERWTTEGHIGTTESTVHAVGWADGGTTLLVSTEWTPKTRVSAPMRDAQVQLFLPDLATLNRIITQLTDIRDNHVRGVYSGE